MRRRLLVQIRPTTGDDKAARGRRRTAAIAVSALLLCIAPSVDAQERKASRGPEIFVDRVEVRVVNLEAVVIDRDGRRVIGLDPSDFTLEVDGRVVPIDYFSEITDGVATVAVPEADDGDEPVAPAGVSPGEPVGTSYLVFVDSYLTTRAGRRNRILDEIEANIPRLGAEDRMAVVSFSGRKLDVLSSWSRSPAQLAEAFDQARGLSARGFLTDAIASDVDRDRGREAAIVATTQTQDAALSDGTATPAPTAMVRRDGLPGDICYSIRRLEARLEREVLAVTAALRSFARPPGRKVMMLLSGGWPHSAKQFLVSTAGPFGALECREKGPKIYRPIFDTANRLGYTLYPIDVPAPSGPAINAAATGSALFGGGQLPPGPVGASVQFDREHEEHSTLLSLAAETGGQAMLDGKSFAAFDEVIADTRSYYWLGFAPEWQENDSSHDIRLRVNEPGMRVRTRKGFIDFSRSAEVSYVTESALLFGGLPGASPLVVEFGEPRRGRRLEIPLRLTIPLDEIAMLPARDGYAAELELRISVLDERGNRNDMPVIPIVLEGLDAPEPGSHAVYETAIRMRRQTHDVVVSVFDPLTDAVLAATGRVAPRGVEEQARQN